MSRAFINLPLATHPTKFTKGSEQNLVLLHSLRQSREKWISSAFPKFSSTARQTSKSSKNPNQTQTPNSPPHTIQSRGKCDLAIGPHIFYDTMFYEVHYLQQSTSYYSSAYSSILSPSVNPATMMITPEVVNQVNSAASSNPTLANLLQLAAAGKASPDQLKTLGLLVQSLAASNPVFQLPGTTSSAPPISTVATTFPAAATNMNSQAYQTPAPAASTTSAPVPQVPMQYSFDLIIEFRENNTERWLLPRGTASIVASPDNPTNVTVTALLPFSKSNVTSTMLSTEDTEDRLVELELTNTPPPIRDSLWRWAGGEAKIEENRQILDKQRYIRHTYLSYELPEDPDLLMQLQSATAPPNPLKSIKTSGNLYKRPSAPRKRATKAKEATSRTVVSPSILTPTPAPTTVASPVPPSMELDPVHSTALDPPLALLESSVPVSPTVTPVAVTPIPVHDLNPTFFAPPATLINNNNKKPRQPRQPKQLKKQKMKSPPPVIRCLSCGQTDVPLLMGGRFCRPCVEGGRANAEIPQAPLMRSGMAHTTQPSYVPVVQPLKLSPFPSSPNASSSSAAVGSNELQSQSAQGTPPSTTSVGGGGTATTTDIDMTDG
ncbi:hypothetical protein E1B28_009896 [Marasmius oreades]|uniref:Uncharacterized protein n=1 Tax=Marasmius oreades TaxID=181124 RepID=A0A9P7UQK5_9AGAR|nr:uncharacterized protein E1B28_009896 [Marasmius oreades]KAG7090812.1 hypothetical protein E1B28_009896 [Marasmius oreades]